MGDYRELVASQLALDVAVAVHAATSVWPAFERWTIGAQLARCAGSIAANIAEAEGRLHAKDRRRFLYIARGSLNETRHWLQLARGVGLATADSGSQLDRLGRTLHGLIKNAERLPYSRKPKAVSRYATSRSFCASASDCSFFSD